MFADYETEEQQVEAIKTWWEKNRLPIIGGAVLGIAAIFGYRAWDDSQTEARRAAADQFQAVAEAESLEQMETLASPLIEKGDFYGAGAAMMMAKKAVEAEDYAAAIGHLNTAEAALSNAELQPLVKVRKARVYLAMNDLPMAKQSLPEGPEAYAGVIAEIKGDIAYAEGDLKSAYDLYDQALQSGKALVSNRQLLTIKRDQSQAAFTGEQ